MPISRATVLAFVSAIRLSIRLAVWLSMRFTIGSALRLTPCNIPRNGIRYTARLRTLHNRGFHAGECAVAIGSRHIYPTHHHLIHQQIGTPAQKVWALVYMAAVTRRVILERLRRRSGL
jgi:hypothetical protein